MFPADAGTSKDLRTALKVVCDVNSEYRHIQVKFIDFKVSLPTLLLYKFEFSNSAFILKYLTDYLVQKM